MLSNPPYGKSWKTDLERMGGKGDIVILLGDLANNSTTNRTKGVKEVLAKYPGIKIEQEQTGTWSRDKGMTLVNDWLTQGRDFQAVYYPKLSASYVISEEPFFPTLSWVNQLRLRSSYGRVARCGQHGRQRRGVGRSETPGGEVGRQSGEKRARRLRRTNACACSLTSRSRRTRFSAVR